ncbi:MAG TPA: hypothetical protein VIG30_03555, partial [Ktedonobacterales bacterium]
MEYTFAILNIQGKTTEAVESALTEIFAGEERPRVLRLEGSFSAVLARAADPDLTAAYRYLICRPHAAAAWVPVLALGERADGLEVELSRALDGAPVFTIFAYGDDVSGYRLARDGALVDEYVSDPTYFAGDEIADAEIAAARGHPARFSDLLPPGTAPEDFVRVVLRPGWWEERDATPDDGVPDAAGEDTEEIDLVDERDRMRCIALALELWGPSDYPFTG